MDVHARLRQLLNDRNWSAYRLAKECDLSEATISNIFFRNTFPSLPTLEEICKAFQITLSQFFAEEDMVELSPQQQKLFAQWVTLTPSQKDVVASVIQCLHGK